MGNAKERQLNISVRSFAAAVMVIFLLMIAAYLLTLVIPGGAYLRTPDENGNLLIDTAGGFIYVEGGIPFWCWVRPETVR